MPNDFFQQFRDAASGFKRLGADVMDDARINRSNMDKMSLLKLMKKGADVPKDSDDEKKRKEKEASERTRSAARKVFGR